MLKSRRRLVFKIRTKGSSRYPVEEEELYQEVLVMKMRKTRAATVTTFNIQQMMMKKIMNSVDDEVLFKASTGWFRNWVRRFNLTFRKPTHLVDEDSKRHMEKDKKYELKMEEKRGYTRLMEEDDGFEDDWIWNMDETPVSAVGNHVFNKVR